MRGQIDDRRPADDHVPLVLHKNGAAEPAPCKRPFIGDHKLDSSRFLLLPPSRDHASYTANFRTLCHHEQLHN